LAVSLLFTLGASTVAAQYRSLTITTNNPTNSYNSAFSNDTTTNTNPTFRTGATYDNHRTSTTYVTNKGGAPDCLAYYIELDELAEDNVDDAKLLAQQQDGRIQACGINWVGGLLHVIVFLTKRP
jgi:hypothetical protein